MKLTHAFALATLALSGAVGTAHAETCGGVTGTLTAAAAGLDPLVVPLTCGSTPAASFDFTNTDNGFEPSATLTNTSIVLSMFTGDSGGFQPYDAFWSFTLAAGSTFDPTITELSDTFASSPVLNSDLPGGSFFTGFSSDFTTANFRIDGANHAYEPFSPFAAEYKVSIITAVPEPETWAMMLGGLGLLAVVRRKRA